MRAMLYHAAPPTGIPRSAAYRVRINGEEIFVYQCAVASYCLLSAEGELAVEVETLFDFSTMQIRPLSRRVAAHTDRRTISFSVCAPAKLSIEPDGDLHNPLFLLINPRETDVPNPQEPKVRYFAGGQEYDAGEILLGEGETLYIEAGAVVYGNVIAERADGARIRGRGILCGSRIAAQEQPQQMVRIVQSNGIVVEGVTIVDGPSWHLVPVACENVEVRNVNIITFRGNGDGIDIVGDENVAIGNCFVRSRDDCIALKSVHYVDSRGCREVRHVRVCGCVLWNAEWGNAIEIGYETQSREICNVIFDDIDIIHAEFEGYESGGTLTIHNGDRAVVSRILYNNIRIEDSREKLIDLKILFSKYSRDAQRGQIRDIRFHNIQIVGGMFPVSIIRGYDGTHKIEDVVIENLTVHGQKIDNANEAKMVVEIAKNIKFL